ncbi:hypothetical protein AVEN_51592-1 [Araneus ventricosus]|uniref:Uncharacterized protein n=1 Tax=Araneus ventricosus TaxID=182803 RepID=A0A4Y2VRT4_ARAVE|nr:hypothetical protein AVEN_51592-1 [Araneus ventricosus]
MSVCEHDNSKTIRATGMKFEKVKNLEWKDRRGKGDEIRLNNGLPAPYKEALSMKSVPMVSPEVTGTSITSRIGKRTPR